MKRAADLVGAALMLVLLSPVLALALLVSLASYRRSPLFVQERAGRHGRPFRLVKVRTLDPATPSTLAKAHLEEHRPNAACRFLRNHHLDELPQLLNVLAGSMSLVGPRPEQVGLADRIPPGLAEVRSSVRPGVTGLWQVSVAVRGMIPDAPEWDEHYVAHHNLRLDLWILWRTVRGLLGGDLLVGLDQVPGWTGAAVPAPAPDLADRAA